MEEKKEQRKEQKIMPLSAVLAVLECATEELGSAIFAIKNKYRLPAGFLDLALTPVVCKVKEMKNAELSQVLKEYSRDDEE